MKCLILGVGGQDGSYLADILLEEGHEVHGLYRRSSVDNLSRIDHIKDDLTLHIGDITDSHCVSRIIQSGGYDEVYNEADQDDVRASYAAPGSQISVTTQGAINVLEAALNATPRPKVFQPLSATMLKPGYNQTLSDLLPESPYAISKLATYYFCHYYRSLGVPVYTGVMYNHDSPRRGPSYLLQSLCRRAKAGQGTSENPIKVYHPDHMVDIGFSRDYMIAARLIMGTSIPKDYIIRSYNQQSIYKVLEVIGDALGRTLVVRVTQAPTPPPVMLSQSIELGLVTGYVPNTSLTDLVSMILGSLS